VAEYGLTDKGFLKKPYEIIKEEMEEKWVDIFGANINLNPESPQGQIIAINAEAIYDVWEMMEKVFSSFNIDDVGGLLLNHRSQLRGLTRLPNETDIELRLRLKEQLPNNVLKLKDELTDELLKVENIEDVTVKYKRGITEVYALGGNDLAIAKTILNYMPPGALEGNVSVKVDRICDDVRFYRPSFIFIKLEVTVGLFSNLECECELLDAESITNTLLDEACGQGYGNFYYTEYVRNVLAQHKGLRVIDIKLYKALEPVDKQECLDIDFGSSLEAVEIEKFEKIVLCKKYISVVIQ
jgi:hypothetical protein